MSRSLIRSFGCLVAASTCLLVGCQSPPPPGGGSGGDGPTDEPESDTRSFDDPRPPSERDTSVPSDTVSSRDTGPDGPDPSEDTGDTGGSTPDRSFSVETCRELEPPSGDRLCRVEPGNSDQIVVRGDILTTDTAYEGGAVRIDPTTGDAEDKTNTGTIQCAGCNCNPPGQVDPTVVTCADAVVSPGLINPHDHLGWGTYGPRSHGETRYDHRHDWRVGARDHDSIETPDSDFSRQGILHGELRHLFGGATSIAGSTSGTAPQGLLRNLDTPEATEGLEASVNYSTFPLGDVRGTLKKEGCDYGRTDSASSVRSHEIYLPHVSEGIDKAARNEYTCLSQFSGDGDDLIEPNTSIIHGIGMTAEDIRSFARAGKALVWSPRTNISLYGHTAAVATYDFFDVPIALGTDWSISGSRNMLRELACVDRLNQNYYGERLSDYDIWRMATYNGALSLGVEDRLGDLAEGYAADLAIFAKDESERYRAVIEAQDDDVALVMRGGEPLYGQTSIIDGLLSSEEANKCTALDVCGSTRRVCVARDTADNADGPVDLARLREAASSDAYSLFSCNDPVDKEPTCTPLRPQGGKGQGYEFQGMTSSNDPDGDGVPSSEDNCPAYFNPGQPLDGDGPPLTQADSDGDGKGDVCDPCPISDDDTCSERDWDGDGVSNTADNCPYTANPGQADDDGDDRGDVCDASKTPYDLDTNDIVPGDEVQLDDVVVTAVDENTPGIYVQLPPDDPRYDGVGGSATYVYLGSEPVPERGDRVTVRGYFEFFYQLPQLTGVTALEVESEGGEVPEPTRVTDPCAIATGGARADALRGNLVRIENVTVQSEPTSEGEFTVGPSCSNGRLRVGNLMHKELPDQVEKGDELDYIVGNLHFSFDNSKIHPRETGDVGFSTAPLENVTPEETSVPARTTSAAPLPDLTVDVTRKSSSPTQIQLNYPDSQMLTGPSSMTVPAGQTEATVPALEGGTPSRDRQDRATLELTGPDGNTESVEILVYDDTIDRNITEMTVQPTIARRNERVQVTIELDVPAKSSGQTIWLSSNSDLDLPNSNPLIPGRQLETTFEIGTGASIGRKVLEARIGSDRKTATIAAVNPGSQDCLIISEYIEGSGYRNKAVEVFNCGGPALDLSNFGLCIVSNDNTTCGDSTALASKQLKPYQVHTLCKDKSKRSSDDPVDGIVDNCDQASSSVMGFNGDDRLVLFRDANGDGDYQPSTDELLDAFGQPGQKPSGTPWKDTTYRRCNYTPYEGNSTFQVSSYYESFPTDDASDFGQGPPIREPGCR